MKRYFSFFTNGEKTDFNRSIQFQHVGIESIAVPVFYNISASLETDELVITPTSTATPETITLTNNFYSEIADLITELNVQLATLTFPCTATYANRKITITEDSGLETFIIGPGLLANYYLGFGTAQTLPTTTPALAFTADDGVYLTPFTVGFNVDIMPNNLTLPEGFNLYDILQQSRFSLYDWNEFKYDKDNFKFVRLRKNSPTTIPTFTCNVYAVFYDGSVKLIDFENQKPGIKFVYN